ncbi:MAG: MaoC family dehydratase [Alphaproteobacteria bacterium]
MEVLGMGLFFEDLPVGRCFKTFGRTVTEADITNFVNCVGMTEVLFTNVEYLKTQSEIGKRFAPGALTFSMAEGLLAVYSSQMTGEAFLGLELKIDAPTYAGDTIHVETEITESRQSRSKPHLGIVHSQNRVINQRQEVVMNYKAVRMIRVRGSEK